MSFQIVKYSPEYQDAVVDLWNKCDLIVPHNLPIEDIQKKLDFQPELFFIALRAREVMTKNWWIKQSLN